MKILAISDLHVDEHDREPWETFLARVQEEQPDVLVVAGDLTVGKSGLYETLLSQFGFFSGPKLFVPGNHDLWQPHSRRETWQRYDEELPAAVSAGGWQYLDLGPVLLDDVAFVGGMGWYDYTLRQTVTPRPGLKVSPGEVAAPRRGMKVRASRSNLDWEDLTDEDYATKALQVGDENVMEGVIWNDVFYTDWQRRDAEIVQYFCDKLRDQAHQVATRARKIVAVTHFVPFVQTLQDYREVAPAYARAFAGSTAMGETIKGLPAIQAAIFGHWHRGGHWRIGDIPAWNVSSKAGERGGTLIRI